MKLSIVIPVRNELQTIVPLIERVRGVDYGMSREIIVVDGASTDGTREALQALSSSPEVVLVFEDHAGARAAPCAPALNGPRATFWSCRTQTWSWILPRYHCCSNISRTEDGQRSSDRASRVSGVATLPS